MTAYWKIWAVISQTPSTNNAGTPLYY